MTASSEKLAQSLNQLHELQKQGIIAIQSKDLTRVHRERLVKSGFLIEVIKGWFIPSRPTEAPGDSTAWYASFWNFCSAYLNKRFQKKWCLSPEQSLLLHAENWTVPQQLLVHSPKGNNKITQLPYNTSLFDARYAMPNLKNVVEKNELRLFSIYSALISVSPKFFLRHPTEARAILSTINEPSELLNLLLRGDHSVIAGRLVGALQNIGREELAQEIIKTMNAAGYEIRVIDPFNTETPLFFSNREKSPYVNRMHLMWHEMRHIIIQHFPKPPRHPKNSAAYLKQVEKTYTADAYNSLSIEGYRVSRELIKRVSSGNWNPDTDKNDAEHKNALAARGYWQAFQKVKTGITQVLSGINPGEVVYEDHSDWYRELFAPSVTLGILQPFQLAGYRSDPVYIRSSMHVPPSPTAVRDLMPVFFEHLKEEQNAGVRIVLGHFFFVYIHPYMDGNGRMGRFLMNIMAASGGYPWIIVPVEKRDLYMAALEEASVRQNILPFCEFLSELVIKHP